MGQRAVHNQPGGSSLPNLSVVAGRAAALPLSESFFQQATGEAAGTTFGRAAARPVSRPMRLCASTSLNPTGLAAS